MYDFVTTFPPEPDPYRYDVKDHYWFIRRDRTQAFSSARGIFVPIDDAQFQAWLETGVRRVTTIDSIADLGEVLAQAGLRPTEAQTLDAYKDNHARGIVATAAFKVLFNHENRLRAIERQLSLNGSPPDLTANQARNAIKALM